MNTVLILGDSSSMTIGVETVTYPHVLARKKIFTKNTRIVNLSQPGFASAGVHAAYRHYTAHNPFPDAVVIYIGNNDGVAVPVRQGRYRHAQYLRHRLRNRLGRQQQSTSDTPSPFVWNNQYDPFVQMPEQPDHFYHNVADIIMDCMRRNTAVTLIKPRANYLFPAGLGKGNFLFYRYMTIDDLLSDRLRVFDQRFLAALKLHENGCLQQAAESYKAILQNPHTQQSQEYPLAVAHNYAVARAQSGDISEAVVVLQALLNERWCRREIVLYNLAYLYSAQKKNRLYELTLLRAYMADRSIYRVQKEYTDQLDRLKTAFPRTVSTIAMDRFVTDDDFIDYCHVLFHVHEQLAQKVAQTLPKRIRGQTSAKLTNHLTNPELAFGNTHNFFSYLGVDAPYSRQEITRYIEQLQVGGSVSRRAQTMRQAFEYLVQTPYFSSIGQVLRAKPRHRFELGRFPEFFLIRYAYPYLQYAQEHNLLTLFDAQSKLLRAPQQLRSLLPVYARAFVGSQKVSFAAKQDKNRIKELLVNVSTVLRKHLAQKNQIHNRLKTTIYWYFRESVRFGFHSRISMRYDRVLLEQCAESLCIAHVLNSVYRGKYGGKIEKLAKIVIDTVAVHEYYCGRFSYNHTSAKLLGDYDAALEKCCEALQRL